MTAKLPDIIRYLNELLNPEQYQDYTVNGLQVEGRASIKKLVTGVTANQAFLEAAILAGADAVLVHHGYCWKGEDPRLIGIQGRRVKTLFQNDVSLLAYHLPLDYHPIYGNNAQLARVLGFSYSESLRGIFQGILPNPLSGQALAQHINLCLGREPLHIANDPQRLIKTVAWCTGAAHEFMAEAIKANVDAYITGEVPERAVDVAKENDIQLFAAGHHATERYGVQAVGHLMAEHFHIAHQFIDITSPL